MKQLIHFYNCLLATITVYCFLFYCFFIIVAQVPRTEIEWKSIAHDFEKHWNFSHCIGSMDGKHIVIRPHTGSGSTTLTINRLSALFSQLLQMPTISLFTQMSDAMVEYLMAVYLKIVHYSMQWKTILSKYLLQSLQMMKRTTRSIHDGS